MKYFQMEIFIIAEQRFWDVKRPILRPSQNIIGNLKQICGAHFIQTHVEIIEFKLPNNHQIP